MSRTFLYIAALIFVACAPEANRRNMIPADDFRSDFATHEEFLVGPSRIELPDEIPSDGPFIVLVWAHLGPNSCYKFSRFEVNWVENTAYIKVFAKRPLPGAKLVCYAHPAELRGGELLIDPPEPYTEIELVFYKRGGVEVVYSVFR